VYAATAADLIDDPQNLVSLFTYKYDRAFPRDVAAQEILVAVVSVFGAALVALHRSPISWFRGKVSFEIPRNKELQMLAFAGLALTTALWCSHHHFNMLSPHWSQYHLWDTYFEERKGNEPVYAFQLNWRGETFYSRNRVLQIMGKGASRRMRELVEQPGREFIITEQSRYDSLRSTLPSDFRDKLRIIDQSNNHFYLMVVDE